MSEFKEKYQDLIKKYKNIKEKRDSFMSELSEKKGNMAAYETEKKELISKLKSMGVDPKKLKDTIDKKMEEISEKIDKNIKICEELEDI
jgi:DNA repair exonuclease SbcCD ATPase subunit